MADLESGLEVAPSFSAVTGSVKTSIGDNIDLGIWYSNSGNGVAMTGALLPVRQARVPM